MKNIGLWTISVVGLYWLSTFTGQYLRTRGKDNEQASSQSRDKRDKNNCLVYWPAGSSDRAISAMKRQARCRWYVQKNRSTKVQGTFTEIEIHQFLIAERMVGKDKVSSTGKVGSFEQVHGVPELVPEELLEKLNWEWVPGAKSSGSQTAGRG